MTSTLTLWDQQDRILRESEFTKEVLDDWLLTEAIEKGNHDHQRILIGRGAPINRPNISACGPEDNWKSLEILLEHEWPLITTSEICGFLGGSASWQASDDMPTHLRARIREKFRLNNNGTDYRVGQIESI